jgi:hypothetical protein
MKNLVQPLIPERQGVRVADHSEANGSLRADENSRPDRLSASEHFFFVAVTITPILCSKQGWSEVAEAQAQIYKPSRCPEQETFQWTFPKEPGAP